jgi:iron complex transport system ATP-binding protein
VTPSQSAVSITGVSVAHDGRVVLGPLDLEVAKGSWLCLIGPNGAGKTSLLHAITGLVPHRGSVHVDGQQLERLGVSARARLVALVPQNPTIPHELTVAEYVLLGRTPHISRFGIETAQDRAVAATVIERLDLASFAARPLAHLSGGELQRVLLARALAQDAPVLLLDEPTTALDLGHQQQVLGLIDELRLDYGLTIVTTMHDLTLAGSYADTLVLLVEGVPVACGDAESVLTEAILGRYYRAAVQVVTAPDGTLAVLPVRPGRRDPAPAGLEDARADRADRVERRSRSIW